LVVILVKFNKRSGYQPLENEPSSGTKSSASSSSTAVKKASV
jgi:hypothetical protein